MRLNCKLVSRHGLDRRREKNSSATHRCSVRFMTTFRLATTADIHATALLGEEVNALHHANAPGMFAEPGDPHPAIQQPGHPA
jgi:hypothetical protein